MKSHITKSMSVGLVLAMSLMAGCADQEANQKQQARQQYRLALDSLEQAHRGFADAEVSLAGDMGAYRHEKLAKAASELEKLTPSLTSDEQASAKRTLSAVYRSLGRSELTQALSEWSDWSQRQAGLWEKLSAIGLAEGRAAMHDPDITQAVQQLTALRSLQQQQLAGIENESQQVRQSITQAKAAQSEAMTQRDALLAQGQKLKAQAFVLQGKPRLDIEKQVLELERQASDREMTARRQEIEIDRKQAELTTLDRRASLARTSMQTAEANLQSIRQQSQSAQQSQEKALADASEPTSRINAVKTLESELVQSAPGVSAVMEKFQKARQSADKAVTLASQSMSGGGGAGVGGGGGDRRSFRSESLAAQVLQVDVMVGELAAQSAMSQTLESMQKLALTYRLSDATVQPMSQAIALLKESRQKLSESAKQAVQQADELSQELIGDSNSEASSDPMVVMAGQQAKALQQGRQRLERLAQP